MKKQGLSNVTNMPWGFLRGEARRINRQFKIIIMTLKEIAKNPTTKFVDVRSVGEFNMEHVTGALNIPLDQFQNRYNEIEGLGNTPVVFYCRSGNRSGQAVGYLRQ